MEGVEGLEGRRALAASRSSDVVHPCFASVPASAPLPPPPASAEPLRTPPPPLPPPSRAPASASATSSPAPTSIAAPPKAKVVIRPAAAKFWPEAKPASVVPKLLPRPKGTLIAKPIPEVIAKSSLAAKPSAEMMVPTRRVV